MEPRFRGCNRDCFNCTYADCYAPDSLATGAGHRGCGAVEMVAERVGSKPVNPFSKACDASLYAHRHGLIRDSEEMHLAVVTNAVITGNVIRNNEKQSTATRTARYRKGYQGKRRSV